jgi:hypothetical protein
MENGGGGCIAVIPRQNAGPGGFTQEEKTMPETASKEGERGSARQPAYEAPCAECIDAMQRNSE